MASGHKRLRRRATAVVIHEGKVLLVQDRGKRPYSLPGGGYNRKEPTVSAAAREVFEETGLHVRKVERLFNHDGATQTHHVCLIEIGGSRRIHRQQRELSDARWWNGKDELPLNTHVVKILSHPKIGFLT